MLSEMEKFQRDLLESVKQIKRGEATRTSQIKLPKTAEARAKMGLSQQAFVLLLGVSPRTLQDWEQGRRSPTGAAKHCFKSPLRILRSCVNCAPKCDVSPKSLGQADADRLSLLVSFASLWRSLPRALSRTMRPLPLFALTALLLSTNYAAAKENRVPVMVPISSEWIAKPFDVQFTIKERVQYVSSMEFYITEPSRISHFFDKESPEESRRLWLALGADRGFPGDIQVKVMSSKGEAVYEQTVVRPKTHARYMGRYANLTPLNKLAPGTYKIRLTCLDCSADLAGLKYRFGIVVPYHGK